MNIARHVALVATLWLCGCASLPPPSDLSSTAPTIANIGAAVEPVTMSGTAGAAKPNTPAPVPSKAQPRPLTGDATIALSPITPVQTASSSVVALAAPVDLWERIRRGYAMPDLDNDLVHDREQWYTTRPDYIYRMTERSKKYMFHIVEELELRNMPTELALLPFVESAFNPQAVSGAKAAGMWQFMPATGKFFELKQNVFRDDRRDVLASTRAALDYLQKLYGMFGDWHLALAAYNWGEGSVGRAMAKNQKLNLPTGYTDLSMPMETRMYVPKLQAIKNIVSNPQAFSSKLPVIENHPYFQSVSVRRDIDVALAAKLAEVPLEDFKALNPSLNKPVILAAGTPQILLPWDNADIFQVNLDNYASNKLASWTVWIAPTTMKVSEAAHRVNMTESELRAINAIPPRMLIRAGSTLLVPRGAHLAQDVTEKVADSGQVSFSPEMVQKRMVVKALKGETVASVARRYKLSAHNVAQWNKVGPNASFKPGHPVVLFVSAPALGQRAPSAPPVVTPPSTRSGKAAVAPVTATKHTATPAAHKGKRATHTTNKR